MGDIGEEGEFVNLSIPVLSLTFVSVCPFVWLFFRFAVSIVGFDDRARLPEWKAVFLFFQFTGTFLYFDVEHFLLFF